MIVPMKKYAFLVHHSDYDAFLEGVREVGVLHVGRKKAEPTEEAVRKKLMHKEVSGVIQQLKKRKVEEQEMPTPAHESHGLAIVRSVLDLNAELEYNRQQLATLDKEISYLEPWGDFSPEMVERLKNDAGVELRFFICPEKKFNPQWQQWYTLEVINVIPPNQYFVVFSQPEVQLDIQAEELPAPRFSLSELKEKKAG